MFLYKTLKNYRERAKFGGFVNYETEKEIFFIDGLTY